MSKQTKIFSYIEHILYSLLYNRRNEKKQPVIIRIKKRRIIQDKRQCTFLIQSACEETMNGGDCGSVTVLESDMDLLRNKTTTKLIRVLGGK